MARSADSDSGSRQEQQQAEQREQHPCVDRIADAAEDAALTSAVVSRRRRRCARRAHLELRDHGEREAERAEEGADGVAERMLEGAQRGEPAEPRCERGEPAREETHHEQPGGEPLDGIAREAAEAEVAGAPVLEPAPPAERDHDEHGVEGEREARAAHS